MSVQLDIQKLVKLYVDDDLSLRQLAEKFNTSKETIKRKLQNEGIDIVNKVYKNKGSSGSKNGMWRTDIDVNLIIDLFINSDKNYTTIADELGLDRGVVKRRLQKAGIDVVRKRRHDNLGVQTPMNKLYYKYQKSAEKRGYDFDIDVDTFHQLVQQPCNYCGSTHTSHETSKVGFKYDYTGLDRIDNNKGYIVTNVIPCCKICNQMKSNLNVDVFKEQINKIYYFLRR
jgi:predicted DNA-binding protein YlxM (UPF0122 family)